MTRAWDARPALRRYASLVAGLRPAGRVLMRSFVLALAVVAASSGMYAQSHNHVIAKPSEAQWGPAPPVLPPGAQIAVLSGDPGKPVPYAVRLKFPANYAIPAHSHPTDENVVVITGTLAFGMGDKLAKGA